AAMVDVTRRLPADLATFVGRHDELRRLGAVARQSTRHGPVIATISGMAGVGKTSLAVHLGHQLLRAGTFADVQLAVDLRGYDPNRPPADPVAVLDGFLRVLGMPGDQIHHLNLADRSVAFRRLLAGRTALILLDNAASVDQVSSLLPANPGTVALITSRRMLPGLPGVEHLPLDVFTTTEALTYLRTAIGDERYDSDPGTAAGIADALGHLPLAIALAAGRIRAETDSEWTLADHLQRILERRRQLRLDSAVETALGLSYEDLPVEPQRTLRFLALHPGADMDADAVAALTGTDLATARRNLHQLVGQHLVHQKASDRYELHDLVRAHAGARGLDSDRKPDRDAAATRLAQHYLYTASRAMDLVYPYERDRRPRIAPPATPAPDFADETTAREWLAMERANLLAVATSRTADDPIGDAVTFSAMLWRHVVTVADYADAQTLHRHAVNTAQLRGDVAGQAAALKNLGFVCLRTGRHEQAADSLNRALHLFTDLGDRDGQARVLQNLAIMYLRTSSYARAGDSLSRALDLFTELGDRDGQARALNSLGILCGQTGSYRQANEYFSQALALFNELSDRDGRTMALLNLGEVSEKIGDYERAISYSRQVLTVFEELGDRDGEAGALVNLGRACVQTERYADAITHQLRAIALVDELGDPRGRGEALIVLGEAYHHLNQRDRATDHHTSALAVFTDLGELRGQAVALNRLGESLLATGDRHRAHAAHLDALRHSTQIGDRYEMARAHAGLGHTRHPDDPVLADKHWHTALALFDELGVPDSRELRARLPRSV
ncbi:MAG: hypothetical protein QOD39_3016, partial [Mycobacterium sp.]|nr:hypothetical protein [Mycobacterium sp.]